MFAFFITTLSSTKYPSSYWIVQILVSLLGPLNMAILNILSSLASLQVKRFRMYSEMSCNKRVWSFWGISPWTGQLAHTVKPHLAATSLIRQPHYSGHVL